MPYDKNLDRNKNRMPDFARWILILPASIIGYIGIQIIIGIGSERLPYSDNIQNIISQFANSIIGPWALIYIGAKVAPERHSFFTAKVLVIIFSAFLFSVFIIGKFKGLEISWWLILTNIIGILSAIFACIQIKKESNF